MSDPFEKAADDFGAEEELRNEAGAADEPALAADDADQVDGDSTESAGWGRRRRARRVDLETDATEPRVAGPKTALLPESRLRLTWSRPA